MSLTVSLTDCESAFPTGEKYKIVLPLQREMLAFAAQKGSCLIEAPTGSGKTAVQVALAEAYRQKGARTVYIVVPTKPILDQTAREFPNLFVAYGRNEHECLYFEDRPRADQIPCGMLRSCGHRVDKETGAVHTEGMTPCPYLSQKYQAQKSGKIVLCTMSFYLFNTLFGGSGQDTDVLIIDEVHRLPEIVRNALTYSISDYHLEQSADFLEHIGESEQAGYMRAFGKKMTAIVSNKPVQQPTLLDDAELEKLLVSVEKMNSKKIAASIASSLKGKSVDVASRDILKRVEEITRDLRRYALSFKYSLEEEGGRKPLSYTFAYHQSEKAEGQRVQNRLTVRCYYVAAIVKKLMGKVTVGLSATIGDSAVFAMESGLKFPFKSFPSEFAPEHTRVYVPNDTPNLSHAKAGERDLSRTLRKIAQSVLKLKEKGIRSLVVVVSNSERDLFLIKAHAVGIIPVSYGIGTTARAAAERFRGGEGDVLVGTVSQYGEGIDLPDGTAPVTFFLRPGFPNPNDPQAVFEGRRFGDTKWSLWKWRMMIQALQVRGRNIRSGSDRGVTIFVSQQFRSFVFASLPESLRQVYKNDRTLDQAVEEAIVLLQK